MALLFSATSSVASLIRLSNNYHYLIVSHLLSGLSTALLYCVFEAWYISQHQRKGKTIGNVAQGSVDQAQATVDEPKERQRMSEWARSML